MPLHTVFFYTVSFNLFYTEKILGIFFHVCVYTRLDWHAHAITHVPSHTNTFRNFCGQNLAPHPQKNTQVLVHTKTVYRFFYMQELLCANVFTWFFAHKPVIRKKMRTGGFTPRCVDTHTQKKHTHGIFYTKNVSTQKDFPTHNLLQKLSHTHFLQTSAFTRINFDT